MLIFSILETTTILIVILLAIGAIQGLIYGFILWYTKTKNVLSNRFLATILFFFSYRLSVEILHLFEIGYYDTWYYFLLEFNWIYGTLIYFFALSFVQPNFKLRTKHWIHFLPVIIEVIWSFFIKSQNLHWDGTRESLSWLGYWGYIVWMHYPTVYVIGGLLIAFYAWKALKILNKSPEIPGYKTIIENTKWIKYVIFTMSIASTIFTLLTLIEFFFFDYAFDFFGYPIFIIMAILTYWLGMVGFSRRKTMSFIEVAIPSEKERQQYDLISQKMNQAMLVDKLFKKQELTLASFSEAINTKPYLVTKTVAVVFNKKFPDYINDLRFNDLTELLKDPKNNSYTLLSLAFEAGFNSKASFNRTVKRITGKSPKHLKSLD